MPDRVIVPPHPPKPTSSPMMAPRRRLAFARFGDAQIVFDCDDARNEPGSIVQVSGVGYFGSAGEFFQALDDGSVMRGYAPDVIVYDPERPARPAERYWLQAKPRARWREVTPEEFIAAEQAAGFRAKPGCGPFATAGFTSRDGVRGSIGADPPKSVALAPRRPAVQHDDLVLGKAIARAVRRGAGRR